MHFPGPGAYAVGVKFACGLGRDFCHVQSEKEKADSRYADAAADENRAVRNVRPVPDTVRQRIGLSGQNAAAGRHRPRRAMRFDGVCEKVRGAIRGAEEKNGSFIATFLRFVGINI